MLAGRLRARLTPQTGPLPHRPGNEGPGRRRATCITVVDIRNRPSSCPRRSGRRPCSPGGRDMSQGFQDCSIRIKTDTFTVTHRYQRATCAARFALHLIDVYGVETTIRFLVVEGEFSLIARIPRPTEGNKGGAASAQFLNPRKGELLQASGKHGVQSRA